MHAESAQQTSTIENSDMRFEHSGHARFWHLDGVIGRPAFRSLEILGAALQADGETRSAFAASSIRRRSAAWTILLDWTYRSRRPASALWMTQARSCGK